MANKEPVPAVYQHIFAISLMAALVLLMAIPLTNAITLHFHLNAWLSYPVFILAAICAYVFWVGALVLLATLYEYVSGILRR